MSGSMAHNTDICTQKSYQLTMKPPEIQYTYKKQIGFTEKQHQALIKLESYGVNVNQFIRQAVAEKIKRDWKQIKEKKERVKLPF